MSCVCLTGIDSEGHAANFVETEQIVLYEGAKASFIQVSIMMAAHALTFRSGVSELIFEMTFFFVPRHEARCRSSGARGPT